MFFVLNRTTVPAKKSGSRYGAYPGPRVTPAFPALRCKPRRFPALRCKPRRFLIVASATLCCFDRCWLGYSSFFSLSPGFFLAGNILLLLVDFRASNFKLLVHGAFYCAFTCASILWVFALYLPLGPHLSVAACPTVVYSQYLRPKHILEYGSLG